MATKVVTDAVDCRWENQAYCGGWRPTSSSADVIEPATGDVIGRIGVLDIAQVREACAAAKATQQAWEKTSLDVRASILRKVAQLIEERFGELAEWIARETGSTMLKAQVELGFSIRAVYDAASMPMQPNGLTLPSDRSRLSYCRRRPLGVVGIISPFNFPFFLGIRAVAPALAVGNTAMLKPNPLTAVSGGLLIAQLFADAGLPDGVLHVVPGDADIGELLCDDPNVSMIHFVGSTVVGRKVGERAGKNLKKVSLEMGGKNSLIILDDADLDLAATNAAWASFMHQGQICFAAGRTLVQRSILDKFIEKMVEKTRKVTVGNPMREDVNLGPLINEVQAGKVDTLVKDSVGQGAKVHIGGERNGRYFSPTVLTGVVPGMRAFDEEIFGPVVSITPFDTDEEAIRLANQTEYGLSAAIISKSLGRALAISDELRVGIIHINDQTVGEEVVNPVSGWGNSGNGSGIGGPANWDEFSQWQWITVKDEPPAYPIGL